MKNRILVIKIVWLGLFVLNFCKGSLGSEQGWKLIDDLSDPSKWHFYSSGVQAKISGASENEISFTKIEVDFGNQEGWMGISKTVDISKNGWGEFSFWVKGGINNNLIEFKVEDQTGTTYGKKIAFRGYSADWIRFVVRVDELQYWWGPNHYLGEVKKIHLCISGTLAKGKCDISFKDLRYNPSRLFIDVSQVGYHPLDQKIFIVRGSVESSEMLPALHYQVIEEPSGKVVAEEMLEKIDFKDWSGLYWKGDFSSLEKIGRYKIRVLTDSLIPGYVSSESGSFEIGENIIQKTVAPAMFNFFRAMRWDPRRHPKDEIKGGYYDTDYDTCKRPWSLTHVLRSFARYVKTELEKPQELRVAYDEALEELLYLSQFCIDVVQQDGAVSWLGLNEFTRRKAEDKSILATSLNVVALCEASDAFKTISPDLSAATLEAARKCWSWVEKQSLTSSSDLGSVLWASLKLYEVTKDQNFIQRAPDFLERLLSVQSLDYQRFEKGASGAFNNRSGELNFSNGYKYFVHGQGTVQMALLDYCRLMNPDSAGWLNAYYSNEVFARQFLSHPAEKSPYGIVSLWLEPQNGGKYFSLKYGPKYIPNDPVFHALNCDYLGFASFLLNWAELTGNQNYRKIAYDQIQWVLGKNPLGLCMISKIGEHYPQVLGQFGNVGDEILGGIPNGIMFDETGEPSYMRESYISSEYWLPHNAYFLTVLSDLNKKSKTLVQFSGVDEDPFPKIKIKLHVAGDFSAGKSLKVVALITNEEKEAIKIPLRSYLRGVEGENVKLIDLSLEPEETQSISWEVFLSGKEPFFARVDDPRRPVIHDELYAVPLKGQLEEYSVGLIPTFEVVKSVLSESSSERLWENVASFNVQTQEGRSIPVKLDWDQKGLYIDVPIQDDFKWDWVEVMVSPSSREFMFNNGEFWSERFSVTGDSEQKIFVPWENLRFNVSEGSAMGFNIGFLRKGPDGEILRLGDWHFQSTGEGHRKNLYEIGLIVLKNPIKLLGTLARISTCSAMSFDRSGWSAFDESIETGWQPDPSDRQPWIRVRLDEERELTGLSLISNRPSSASVRTSLDGENWSSPIPMDILGEDESVLILQEPHKTKMIEIQWMSPLGQDVRIGDIKIFDMEHSKVFSGVPLRVVQSEASSVQGEYVPRNAFDQNFDTRYGSEFKDGEWLKADLGNEFEVGKVQLAWETAFAQEYRIEISKDGVEWETVFYQEQGAGRKEIIRFTPMVARYIRIIFDRRGTIFGSSLWEMKIYGKPV